MQVYGYTIIRSNNLIQWHLSVNHIRKADQEKRIHAFISGRLDYCNSLLTGLPQNSIKQLQLLTRTNIYKYITPVPKDLHCIPISCTIDFKILLLVYHLLNDLGPVYIKEMMIEYVGL